MVVQPDFSKDSLSESQLRRLLSVGRSLVTELDIEALLGQVLGTAKDLTGARYAALGILDPEKASLERFLHLGIDEATRRGIGPLPEGRGVLGELIRNPEPLRLSRVGDHSRSYGFPPGHPPMNSFLGVPIQIRGEAFGNIYLTEKPDGEQFDEVDEAMLVVLADWAAVAIGNARLYEQSEGRRTELERAVQALEATVSLARVGAAETDFDSLLELISKRARALIESRVLLLLSPTGEGPLSVLAAAGDADVAVPQRLLAGSGVILADAETEGRVLRLDGKALKLENSGSISTEAGLAVHMEHRGESQGYIVALGPEGRSGFSQDDELLMQSFASSAASSLASARNVEQDRLRMTIEASEQERRRWARELHDQTLQDLGALKVMLDSMFEDADAESMKRSSSVAARQLEETTNALEALIHELRPATLDELGPAAAIETLIQRAGKRNGLGTKTHIDLAFEAGRSSARLSPELESTIFRVVQEALNNTVKHAAAETASVSIVETDNQITVFVEDDGAGFDPAKGFGGRLGLHGMRERVALAAGQLEVDSAPGKGTRVEVHLPVITAEAD
ncbi:MAG: GAF domain-containing sensor histidine kinase [Solirubrobacterales bacterium]